MLTKTRLDEIKKTLEIADKISDDIGDGGKIMGMLRECVAELDRVNSIPHTGNRGHLKPVILDAQGQAVAPPPISHQLQLDRKIQYSLDRFDAVMSLDPDQFRIFSLRWGLVPPPGGWANHDLIINTMHAIRIGLEEIPYIEKHKSAMHMVANNIKLPPGVYFEGGVLKGVALSQAER